VPTKRFDGLFGGLRSETEVGSRSIERRAFNHEICGRQACT
jgi:hypothetical protein